MWAATSKLPLKSCRRIDSGVHMVMTLDGRAREGSMSPAAVHLTIGAHVGCGHVPESVSLDLRGESWCTMGGWTGCLGPQVYINIRRNTVSLLLIWAWRRKRMIVRYPRTIMNNTELSSWRNCEVELASKTMHQEARRKFGRADDSRHDSEGGRTGLCPSE